MKVPENAREQLRATLKSMDMQPDKHWVDVPRWAVPLILAYLDLQDATSEVVTEVRAITVAATAYLAAPVNSSAAVKMRHVLKAVAPALLLAGERRGLAAAEDAAHDAIHAAVEEKVECDRLKAAVEAAIRALGRPA